MTDEIESYVVGASAIATAVFSFLIWRANIQSAKAAKGAADAALESARISKLMLDAQEEQKQNLRDQLKRDILRKCTDIVRIFEVMVSEGVTSELMNRLPEEISVTNFELANYFTKDERRLIFNTAKKYEAYREDYFKDGKPSFTWGEKLTKDCGELLDSAKDVIIKFADQIVISNEVTIS